MFDFSSRAGTLVVRDIPASDEDKIDTYISFISGFMQTYLAPQTRGYAGKLLHCLVWLPCVLGGQTRSRSKA
jgi:hypothetical protein